MKFRKYHLILLSLLAGVILTLAWPERGFPGLLFIGLVPMLYVEDYISRNREKFIKFSVLFYSYPGFFVWNLLTTWWIANSTLIGAVLAIVLNALFMSIIFQMFHWLKKKVRFRFVSFISLVCFWVAFEYLHLNWDLNWPWLNLGNGFATYYKWVQWYEYTGTFGGSVWIIVGNILIFMFINTISFRTYGAEFLRDLRLYQNKAPTGPIISPFRHFTISPFRHFTISPFRRFTISPFRHFTISPFRHFTISLKSLLTSKFVIQYLILILLWISIPIILSFCIYANYKEDNRPVNFVVVQPNIDPYSEQYELPPSEVIGRIMALAAPQINTSTNFLIAPESAIQESMWENDLSTFTSIRLLKQAIAQYPGLNMLIGGSTFYKLAPGETPLQWTRKFTDTGGHYNAYNAAIMLNSRDSLQLYHKSKLTPGVEILPSFKGLKWLEKFAINLGGTVGSLGMDSVQKVYTTVNTVKVGPAICYESIFGEFFAQFVKNGAQIMIIITNDGWWANTAGHRQHFGFARLRAIETRRSIARSANTGISAFIDQRGDAHQATAYWVPTVIKGSLNSNDKLTFYVKHGDYIARFMTWMGGLLLITAMGMAIKQKYYK